MTDVVEIAKKRHVKLVAEIGELSDFIHMAETLVEDGEIDAKEEHDSKPVNLFAKANA